MNSGTSIGQMMFRDPNALQIRVTLARIEPPVWRRLIVPLSWRLDELHLAIQAAFNWWNAHLHEFRIGGLRYGDLDSDDMIFDDGPRLFDEREVTLRDFDHDPGNAFVYLYDFGDDWRHIVQIEDLLALDLAPRLAALHRRRKSQAARGCRWHVWLRNSP